MKHVIRTALAVFIVLIVLNPSRAVAAEEKVALCEFCNSPAFRNAAEVAALSETPRLEEGTQYVFVVDIRTDEIRYYEIVREYIEICLSPDDANATKSTGPVIDPENPPEIPDCSSSWVTSSTQLAPPAATVAELLEAQEAFGKFMQEIQEFDVGELPIGIVPLDSATDLIGPGSASHDPEFFRNTLQNALSNKVFDIWTENNTGAGLSDLGRKMFGERLDFENMDSITVNFPDGTSVEVEVVVDAEEDGIIRDEFGNFKGLKLKVDITSAAGDQLPTIPTTAAGFISAFQNRFTGDPSFVESLSDLFVRGGGRVIRGPPRGNCTATIMCWVEDGEQVCQESFPDPQLSGC